MNFQSLSQIFNRALKYIFSKKKCLTVFLVLALSGLLVVFFRGVAINAGKWVKLSLTFLPIFFCTGILFSMGIYLIRIYHDEVLNREVSYLKTLSKSWEVIIGSTYFTIPIILIYLVLWVLLGIFVLLSEMPYLGNFFGVILSFAPFLIHLASLLLCLSGLVLLFVLSPVIALKGLNRELVLDAAVKRIGKNPFSTILLGLIAVLPLFFIVIMLTLAAYLTGSNCLECSNNLQVILKWFFIMLPYTACLTPGVIFFFNFAAESFVLLRKEKNHQ